jgi:hypothetical protein
MGRKNWGRGAEEICLTYPKNLPCKIPKFLVNGGEEGCVIISNISDLYYLQLIFLAFKFTSPIFLPDLQPPVLYAYNANMFNSYPDVKFIWFEH